MTVRPTPWRVVAVLPLMALAAACGGRGRALPGDAGRGRCAHPGHRLAVRRPAGGRAPSSWTSRSPATSTRWSSAALIRVGVTFNRTHYFIDRGRQRGITYECAEGLRDELNNDLKTGNLKVHVVLIPMPRDQLSAGADEGQGRHGRRDGHRAARAGGRWWTSPSRRAPTSARSWSPGRARRRSPSCDDLSGQEVFVRTDSTYYESLPTLNEQLKARGKPPVVDRRGARRARGRRHPRDGQRRPGADHRRRRLPGRVLEAGLHRPHRARGRRRCAPAASWPSRSARTVRSCRRPSTPGSRSTARATASGNVDRAPLPANTKYVEERRGRRRAQEAGAVIELFQEVRRPVRPRLPADGRAGLPGIDAGSERQEPRRRDRRDAGHAADRQGAEGRRHQPARAEHPRRREVHAVHDRPLLQGRADGPT